MKTRKRPDKSDATASRKSKPPATERGGAVKGATPHARSRSRKPTVEEIKEMIIASRPSEAALTDIMLQCSTLLASKRAIKFSLAGRGGLCHTVPDQDMNVSIWQNGFKIRECKLADAEAEGIRPCG